MQATYVLWGLREYLRMMQQPLLTLLDLFSFCSVAAYSLQAFVLKCPLSWCGKFLL
jgi:hypothetical protein